jgi:hypothetical protein
MKIVINTCQCGFVLSDEAILRYAEIKGIQIWIEGKSEWSYWLLPPEDRVSFTINQDYYSMSKEDRNEYGRKYLEQIFRPYEIERTDPVLIQVVEELGDKAVKYGAKLKVVEIPDDVNWELNQDYGRERISEIGRTWE